MRTFLKRITAMIALIALIAALLPSSALAVTGTDRVLPKTESPERDGIWDGSIATGFAGGTGTEEDPYLISNGSELAYLAQQVNNENDYSGAYFKLTNDICLNDTSDWESWGDSVTPQNEWTAIGNAQTPLACAYFDGDGHTVKGIYINSPEDFHGLFGCNSIGSVIANIGVTESYVYGVCRLGGVGGIIACNYGDVINCFNMGTMTGDESVGGVVGCNYGNVIGCYNTGSIIGSGDYMGGVVGLNSGTVSDCYNTGNVSGDYYVGGVIGEIWSGGTITNCYNTGDVVSSGDRGGVVGFIFTGTVNDCYYYADCCPGGNSYGKALSSEELLLAESFVGFDFDLVWTMDGNPEYPYPELIGNEHGGMSTVTPVTPGDVDGDGAITMTDATLVVRMALNLIESVPAADFNGDGSIDMVDATLTARKALNLI